jgi:preprotein translocase subunit SecF
MTPLTKKILFTIAQAVVIGALTGAITSYFVANAVMKANGY